MIVMFEIMLKILMTIMVMTIMMLLINKVCFWKDQERKKI